MKGERAETLPFFCAGQGRGGAYPTLCSCVGVNTLLCLRRPDPADVEPRSPEKTSTAVNSSFREIFSELRRAQICKPWHLSSTCFL